MKRGNSKGSGVFDLQCPVGYHLSPCRDDFVYRLVGWPSHGESKGSGVLDSPAIQSKTPDPFVFRVGGTTHYHADSSLDATGHLTQEAKEDAVFDDFHLRHNIGIAPTDGMAIDGDFESARKAIITFDMAANNPLEPLAPSIDYDFTLTIDFSNPIAPIYNLAGDHDGFPCYEVYLNDVMIYGHASSAHGQTPESLFPPQEFEVDEQGNVR